MPSDGKFYCPECLKEYRRREREQKEKESATPAPAPAPVAKAPAPSVVPPAAQSKAAPQPSPLRAVSPARGEHTATPAPTSLPHVKSPQTSPSTSPRRLNSPASGTPTAAAPLSAALASKPELPRLTNPPLPSSRSPLSLSPRDAALPALSLPQHSSPPGSGVQQSERSAPTSPRSGQTSPRGLVPKNPLPPPPTRPPQVSSASASPTPHQGSNSAPSQRPEPNLRGLLSAQRALPADGTSLSAPTASPLTLAALPVPGTAPPPSLSPTRQGWTAVRGPSPQRTAEPEQPKGGAGGWTTAKARDPVTLGLVRSAPVLKASPPGELANPRVGLGKSATPPLQHNLSSTSLLRDSLTNAMAQMNPAAAPASAVFSTGLRTSESGSPKGSVTNSPAKTYERAIGVRFSFD
jgi:hypothetical protein